MPESIDDCRDSLSTFIRGNPMHQTETPYWGLAPLLRMSIAGVDFRSLGQEMLATAESGSNDPNLLMNLSTVMLSLGQRDFGLAVQALALKLRRVYRVAATQQPAKLRLLLLVVPGDLAANTPLDCLLENSDIDLEFYYVSPGMPFAAPIPDHDVVMIALSESDENRDVLAALQQALIGWPKPIINRAENISTTDRNRASMLLQQVPGLLMPPTVRVSRSQLQSIAAADADLSDLFEGCAFPIILRPVGSHAGRDLDKIDCAEQLGTYLGRVDAAFLFLSRFVDYSGADGLFRKFRIALIDGEAFACHMAVSSDWMIHYVNAGMYEDAQKRAEEAAFMAHFDAFSKRHRLALDAIYRRTQLDYVCIDCAETRAGELLVFEIDHAMVVHAMDPEDLFPYKAHHMQMVKTAFRDFLLRLTAASAS